MGVRFRTNCSAPFCKIFEQYKYFPYILCNVRRRHLVGTNMAKKNAHQDAVDAAGVRRESAQPAAQAVSLSALREQADGLRRAQLIAGLGHVVTRADGSFESWSETLPTLLGIQP